MTLELEAKIQTDNKAVIPWLAEVISSADSVERFEQVLSYGTITAIGDLTTKRLEFRKKTQKSTVYSGDQWFPQFRLTLSEEEDLKTGPKFISGKAIGRVRYRFRMIGGYFIDVDHIVDLGSFGGNPDKLFDLGGLSDLIKVTLDVVLDSNPKVEVESETIKKMLTVNEFVSMIPIFKQSGRPALNKFLNVRQNKPATLSFENEHEINKKDVAIFSKTDGIRCTLAVVDGTLFWLMDDNKVELFDIEIKVPDVAYDAEFVVHNKRQLLIVFDGYDKSKDKSSFVARYDKVCSYLNEISKNISTFAQFHPVEIISKIPGAFEYVAPPYDFKYFNHTTGQEEHIDLKEDGYVLVNHYHNGNYSYEDQPQLKWKPNELNTVDLTHIDGKLYANMFVHHKLAHKLVAKRKAREPDVQDKKLTDAFDAAFSFDDNDEPVLIKTSADKRSFVFYPKSNTQCLIEAIPIYSDNPSIRLDKYSINHGPFKTLQNEKIYEFKYDHKKNEFTAFRERFEKPYPNAVLTFDGIVRNAVHPIKLGELSDGNGHYFKETNTEPDVVLMRKLINFMKIETYEAYFKRAPVLIDLAAGKGQDMGKYSSEKVICFDLDKVALAELGHRYSTDRRLDFDLRSYRVDLNGPFGSEEKSTHVVMNLAIHYLDDICETLKKVWICKKGSVFAISYLDGVALKELMGNEKKWDTVPGNNRYPGAALNKEGYVDMRLPFSQGEYYSEKLIDINEVYAKLKSCFSIKDMVILQKDQSKHKWHHPDMMRFTEAYKCAIFLA